MTRNDLVQRFGIIFGGLLIVSAIWSGSWWWQLVGTILLIGELALRWIDQRLIEVQRTLIDLYRREAP